MIVQTPKIPLKVRVLAITARLCPFLTKKCPFSGLHWKWERLCFCGTGQVLDRFPGLQEEPVTVEEVDIGDTIGVAGEVQAAADDDHDDQHESEDGDHDDHDDSVDGSDTVRKVKAWHGGVLDMMHNVELHPCYACSPKVGAESNFWRLTTEEQYLLACWRAYHIQVLSAFEEHKLPFQYKVLVRLNGLETALMWRTMHQPLSLDPGPQRNSVDPADKKMN